MTDHETQMDTPGGHVRRQPDRPQLTEALEWSSEFLAQAQGGASLARIRTIIEAAEWARDFPTDAQVEAACRAFGHPVFIDDMRAALEAVTMIGDTNG